MDLWKGTIGPPLILYPTIFARSLLLYAYPTNKVNVIYVVAYYHLLALIFSAVLRALEKIAGAGFLVVIFFFYFFVSFEEEIRKKKKTSQHFSSFFSFFFFHLISIWRQVVGEETKARWLCFLVHYNKSDCCLDKYTSELTGWLSLCFFKSVGFNT